MHRTLTTLGSKRCAALGTHLHQDKDVHMQCDIILTAISAKAVTEQDSAKLMFGPLQAVEAAVASV